MKKDNPIRRERSSRRIGFSLIEVMVGTALMSIVMLAIPAAFLGVRKLNHETETLMISGEIISSKLERLRTLEFETLESMVGSPVSETQEHNSRRNIIFTVKTEITNGADELDGMLEAEVYVSWTENRRMRKNTGRAFFAENGLSDKKFDDAN